MAPLVTPLMNVSMSSRESARPSRLRAMMSTKGIGAQYTKVRDSGPGTMDSGLGTRDSGFGIRDSRLGFGSRIPSPGSQKVESIQARVDPADYAIDLLTRL